MRLLAVTGLLLLWTFLAPGADAQSCPLWRGGDAGPADFAFEPFEVNAAQVAGVWYDLEREGPSDTLGIETVAFSAGDAPAGFEVSVGRTSPNGEGGSNENWSATVTVKLTRVVNATTFPIPIVVSVACNGQTVHEEPIVLRAPVAYVDGFEATATETFQRAGQNSKVVFPIEMHNRGNWAVQLSFSENQTEGPPLAAITVPPDGVAVQPGQRRHLAVTVLTPTEYGHADFTSKFRVDVDVVAIKTNDTDVGGAPRSVPLDFALNVIGVYVPGPAALLTALALGAAVALAVRQRL